MDKRTKEEKIIGALTYKKIVMLSSKTAYPVLLQTPTREILKLENHEKSAFRSPSCLL